MSGLDVTDYFQRGGTAEALLAEFERLRFDDVRVVSATRAVVRRASDIVSRRQRFLWDPYLPLGVVALAAGRGGVGKSTFTIYAAVEAQFGRLPGDLSGEPISVLYVSAEDTWETQMKPRLIAAGADLNTFYQLSIAYTTDEATGERTPLLPEDTERVREAIIETGARLVILDPITASILADDHKREVVRAVLDPLAVVAAETGAVIVGIMHFNKGAGVASDKLSGSHAYRDAARTVLLFAADEDEGRVVMTQDKGNYSQQSDSSLAYRLVDVAVELDDGEIAHVPRVEMLGATSTTVSEIINRAPTQDEVVAWLRDFMADNDGRVSAKEAEEAGQQAGFSKYQLTRARNRARPRINSIKSGMDGGWVWVAEDGSKNAEASPGATFRDSGPRERNLRDPDPEDGEGAIFGPTEEGDTPEEGDEELSKSRRKRSRRPQQSSAPPSDEPA